MRRSAVSISTLSRGPPSRAKPMAKPKAVADAGGDTKPNPNDSSVKAPGDGKGAGSRKLCVNFIYSKGKNEQCPDKHAAPEGGDEKEYCKSLYPDLTGRSTHSDSPRSKPSRCRSVLGLRNCRKGFRRSPSVIGM